jgi:hypothetical protein
MELSCWQLQSHCGKYTLLRLKNQWFVSPVNYQEKLIAPVASKVAPLLIQKHKKKGRVITRPFTN